MFSKNKLNLLRWVYIKLCQVNLNEGSTNSTKNEKNGCGLHITLTLKKIF